MKYVYFHHPVSVCPHLYFPQFKSLSFPVFFIHSLSLLSFYLPLFLLTSFFVLFLSFISFFLVPHLFLVSFCPCFFNSLSFFCLSCPYSLCFLFSFLSSFCSDLPCHSFLTFILGYSSFCHSFSSLCEIRCQI